MSKGRPEGVKVVYHGDYELHKQFPGHPERPERVSSVMTSLKRCGFPHRLIEPPKATLEEISLVHSPAHIERIRDFGVGFMDPDTFHTDLTYEHSLRAAGGAITAAKLAVSGSEPVFCFPRPPGHHAGMDYNMGFCYLNNIAIAARYLQKNVEGIDNLAIIDIDAHHGNGTSDIFYEDPSLLYVSTHEWGIFPGTGHEREMGRGKGAGKTVNLPLVSGQGDGTTIGLFREIAIPIVRSYGPDAILVSFGLDGHLMDPLSTLSMSSKGYIELAGAILELADEVCSGRIAFILEGGYHLEALSESVLGAMNLCLDEPMELKPRYIRSKDTSPDRWRIRELLELQSSNWGI